MRTAALSDLGMRSSTCPVTRRQYPNVSRSFGGHIHISYNPSSSDYASDTTAIVVNGQLFFLLNGNHAEALCKAATEEGAMGCAAYFAENISCANKHSEHVMASGLCNDPFALQQIALEVFGSEAVERIATAAKALLSVSASTRESHS